LTFSRGHSAIIILTGAQKFLGFEVMVFGFEVMGFSFEVILRFF
jgi:hypothetical protein